MIKQLLQQFRFRMMARQLRKPGFGGGRKTGRMMNKANDFLYERIVSLINPKAGNQILEIGFGNGNFFSKFFDHSSSVQITGIDYSAMMVKSAAKNNKEYLKKGNLFIYKAESNKLPLPDNIYDVVFCINVIYFWNKPEQHLKEVLRVLKPSGTFYSIFRTKESMQLMPFTQYGFHSYNGNDWSIILNKAGFEKISNSIIEEPDILFKEKILQIESFCVKGVKPHYK